MTQQKQNPLRAIADSQFGVTGGSDNLIANGIYSVDDIVLPILTHFGPGGDPRLFTSYGQRRTRINWRRVNRDGWLSPKRKQKDDKDTVIQIKYARPKKLNYLAFELLRVPQQWTVKYYDYDRRRMVFLSDTRGRRVDGSLSGFKNNVVSPRHEKNNANKWRRYEFDLPTLNTNLIEIHMNREVKDPPIMNLESFFGLSKDTPYSLGVRNLSVKLKITNDDNNDDDDDGTPTPIGTTERPVITRYVSTNAHDGHPNTYWECGPQGAANSMVPFYVDMRLDDGSPAIFDRMKLVPLFTGPSMSIYWSNDNTTTPWKVSQNRVDFERLGDADFTDGEGISVTAAADAWSVSNDYMKLDLAQNFMVGLLFTPTDTNTGGTGTSGNRYLWNFERPGDGLTLSFRFNPSAVSSNAMTGTFEAVSTTGGTDTTLFTSASYTLNKNSQYGVVFGYNQNHQDPSSKQGWHLAFGPPPAHNDDLIFEDSSTNQLTSFYPTSLTIGSNQAATLTRPMQGTVCRFWVRMGYFSQKAARSYLTGPKAFTQGDGDTTQRVNGLYNAVLVAKLINDTEARIGPGAGYYRNKEWTPIPIDYGLQSSQYQLPLTRAKFLKLEFSNLVPRVYLTQEKRLPVSVLPIWVTDWYRNTARTGQPGPYVLAGGRNYFEAVQTVPVPGDPRRLADVREVLEGKGSTGIPPIVYHNDQSSADYAINPQNYDGASQYRELEFAATHMRFYRTSRHEYDTRYIQVKHRAFFVGIKELRIFRTQHTIQFDSREYNETYDDSLNITSSPGWINVGGGMTAQAEGDQILSKIFPSFSNFDTVQMAVLDSGWESGFSDAQIDLATISHLVDPKGNVFSATNDTATTHFDVVTGQYQGARGGNVLQVGRTAGSTSPYGLRTATGQYNGAITGDNPRTSAVVRLQLPLTNKGTYELRIYANGALVAAKPIKMPVKAWKEREVAYIANVGDTNWQAEVVQTDPAVSEPFIVDMMGIWQNSIKWEISNDPDGNKWYTVLWPLNDPNGYFRFPSDMHKLRVRVTALKAGATVSGWTIIPWYIESSMVMRAPIDYNPPWGVSDQEDLLDTSRKPMFQTWHKFFPQRFSVNLLGYF